MPLANDSALTFVDSGADAGKYARSASSPVPSSRPRASS